MPAHQLLDAAGRPRSPATMPGHHAGRVPPNKGRRYPVVAVMRQAGDTRHGRRMRGLIAVLWRAGVRIHEALTLAETDLNDLRGSLLIRHGKGDRRRDVGMDPWAWTVLAGWTADRTAFPPGPLFCVIEGPTRELLHEGISSEEIIGVIHGRKAPMMHASTGLELYGRDLCGTPRRSRTATYPIQNRQAEAQTTASLVVHSGSTVSSEPRARVLGGAEARALAGRRRRS